MSEQNTRDEYFLDDDDFEGEINESDDNYFLDTVDDEKEDTRNGNEAQTEDNKTVNVYEDVDNIEEISVDEIKIEEINVEEIAEEIELKQQEVAGKEFAPSSQSTRGAAMSKGSSSKSNNNPAKGGPSRSPSERSNGSRSKVNHAQGSHGKGNGARTNGSRTNGSRPNTTRTNGNRTNGNGNRSHRNPPKNSTHRNKNGHSSYGRKSPKKKTNMKAVGILAACVLVLLFVGYVAVSIYFTNHFLFNTRINGQSFSRQTAEEAQAQLMGQVDDYQLTIITLTGDINVIHGSDINMRFEESTEIYELMREQNGFAWLGSFFTNTDIEVDFPLTFDSFALDQVIQNLPVMTGEQIMPTSAHTFFDGTVFAIEPEIPGTAFDAERLGNAIRYAVSARQREIDMQALNVQIQPEVRADSPELVSKVASLNRYLSAVITFDMGEQVVVDGSLIIEWMVIDDDYNVTLLREPIYEWVTEFGNRFSTRGTTRPVTTPRGRHTQVSGGTYGWWIDHAETTALLMNHIRSGNVITTQPVYFINGTAAEFSDNDWGSTFVQVDLTEQHMWYIVNGQVVFETPVITGLPGRSPTPQGVYYILSRESPAVLRGPRDPETGRYEWESPVSYWMPITWDGIGFHDATWQTAGFGGQLYRTLGSQGCINMSLEAAREFFGLISVFTPVVVHY